MVVWWFDVSGEFILTIEHDVALKLDIFMATYAPLRYIFRPICCF